MEGLSLRNEDIQEIAKKMASYNLCDPCLGRQFAKVGHGMSNRERGKKIREYFGLPFKEECWLCDGLMDEIEKFSEMVIEALDEYEYDTFLIGSKVEEDILRKEAEIGSLTPYGESIKQEINREVGKLVEKKTKKEVDFIRPHITAIVNTIYNVIELDVRSIYISGRYKKLKRGIPQTKWYCRKCRGLGCDYCNNTGKMYEESVEEIIAAKVMELTKAKEEYFHGAGREDIDVLMLGNGRPFILEIRMPKKRSIDLSILQKMINDYGKGKVEVSDLNWAEKKDIERLKSAKWDKTYRAIIKMERKGKINEAVRALRGYTIHQRTPSRVSHRRADKIRKRKIHDIYIEEEKMNEITLVIKAESGTYIKELITGDEGRTVPSLSEIAGCAIEVKQLDVIKIGDKNGEKIEGNQK